MSGIPVGSPANGISRGGTRFFARGSLTLCADGSYGGGACDIVGGVAALFTLTDIFNGTRATKALVSSAILLSPLSDVLRHSNNDG